MIIEIWLKMRGRLSRFGLRPFAGHAVGHVEGFGLLLGLFGHFLGGGLAVLLDPLPEGGTVEPVRSALLVAGDFILVEQLVELALAQAEVLCGFGQRHGLLQLFYALLSIHRPYHRIVNQVLQLVGRELYKYAGLHGLGGYVGGRFGEGLIILGLCLFEGVYQFLVMLDEALDQLFGDLVL